MAQFTNMVLLLVLITFFLVSGIAVASVSEEFDTQQTITQDKVQTSTINETLNVASSGNVDPFNVFTIVSNMFKLALIGQVGGLPVVFDLFYSIVALAIVLLALVSFVPTLGGGA